MAKKIWKNDTDWWSAETREEAEQLYIVHYGIQESIDDGVTDRESFAFDEEPLAGDFALSVTFQDGVMSTSEPGKELAYPEWVDRVEYSHRGDVRVERVVSGAHKVAKVTAPASVWAANTDGIVASTEF